MVKENEKQKHEYLLQNDLVNDADYLHDDVPFAKEMNHEAWKGKLINLANENKWKVLEIGCRAITTKEGLKKNFTTAKYTGFDLYEDPLVDVIGDAHHLSKYFPAESFDLVFSAAVFEHLAMPWLVAEEIAKVLKINGYVFIETHYCYNSHARPWHFFQFSEIALQVLFSKDLGFKCLDAGVSTPMVGRFSNTTSPHLRNIPITGLYCHSEIFAQKIARVQDFSWENVDINSIINESDYPNPEDTRKRHY